MRPAIFKQRCGRCRDECVLTTRSANADLCKNTFYLKLTLFPILEVMSAQRRKHPERMTTNLLLYSFQSFFYERIHLKHEIKGRLGGSVGEASDFGSGHHLTVRGFEPRGGFCADSSEPGACFGFYVSLSLCPSPTCALSRPLKKKH